MLPALPLRPPPPQRPKSVGSADGGRKVAAVGGE